MATLYPMVFNNAFDIKIGKFVRVFLELFKVWLKK